MQFSLAMLTEGLRFAPSSSQITFARELGKGRPDWPYGAVLQHLLSDAGGHDDDARRHGPRWSRAPHEYAFATLGGTILLALVAYALFCERWREEKGSIQKEALVARNAARGFVDSGSESSDEWPASLSTSASFFVRDAF